MTCCCHFSAAKSAVLKPLTANTYSTLQTFLSQWADTDKQPEKSLCENFPPVTLDNYNTYSIHKTCYARITSKTKLQCAKNAAIKVSKHLILHLD